METATQPHDHHHHHDHELPTSGSALTGVAVSATLHCLTGCAIGEVLGMVIGTALGFSDWGTVGLAVALAFLFGYGLTSLPLLRAGFAIGAVVPIALASDTFSIAVMEIVDNAIMLGIPGAMHAGVGSLLFWGALSVALVIAGVFAVPVNRWLIARGKGHAVVHETGIHGGPPVRLVAIVAAVAAVFGTTVLAAELVNDDEAGHGGGAPAGQASVRGLAASANGMTLELTRAQLPRGRAADLSFRVVGSDGQPVRDFEVEHEKRMHLIVASRDLARFQHLHPRLGSDGAWRTRITLAESGEYRVFADFKRDGGNVTLARSLRVPGDADSRALPAPANTARVDGGYEVRMAGASSAGAESELRFTVLRDGSPVRLERYLGASGHLVALRERDLAYLHVHPSGEGKFATEFPSEARYRLFLQFKHDGEVHTAAFTRVVGETAATGAGESDGGHDDGH